MYGSRLFRSPEALLAPLLGLSLPLLLAAACAGRGDDPARSAAFAAADPVCVSPADFPAGFGWPQSAATVQGWVDAGNEAAARVHGWSLWAGLNVPAAGGGPVWRSWCTSSQAFPYESSAPPSTLGRRGGLLPLQALRRERGLESGEDPINFPETPGYAIPDQVRNDWPRCVRPPGEAGQFDQLRDGVTFQSNGDVMIAGVIYNQPAFEWIRSRNLYLAATLDAQVPPRGGIAHMAPMPAGSIVLKPMLWPVPASGYSALPLWDDQTDDRDSYAGFEVQSLWPRAVAVTAGPRPVARTDVTYLHGLHVRNQVGSPARQPVTYRDAEVVGLDRFYHFTPDLTDMDECDRALLDASANWAFGRSFQPGDHLALVAMHVMTKEQPAWTFQSVWWHDRPHVGPYAANRPDIAPSRAPGPWRHYLMASTYGIPDPGNPRQWPVAYNPYIELAAAHPIRTNCMNCHHRAAWPGQADGYEATGGPDALAIFTQDNPAIFTNLLGVDSLWSIVDRAGSPPAAPGAPAPRR